MCFNCNSHEDPRCRDTFNWTNQPEKKHCTGCCVKMIQGIGTGKVWNGMVARRCYVDRVKVTGCQSLMVFKDGEGRKGRRKVSLSVLLPLLSNFILPSTPPPPHDRKEGSFRFQFPPFSLLVSPSFDGSPRGLVRARSLSAEKFEPKNRTGKK